MRAYLATALALLLPVGAVQAQDTSGPLAPPAVATGHAEWSLRVTPRLVDRIGSPSAAVRAEALHAVAELAFATSPEVDVRPAIPALLDIFRTEADGRLRTLALRTLEAVGDEAAMAALRAEVDRPMEPHLRRLLFVVLLEHYGVDEVRGDPRLFAMARSVVDHDHRTAHRLAQARLVSSR